MEKQKKRYLISGGGTGGHIFPALSIANAIKERDPQSEILFVGALGRMEMEKVPAAGYRIVGLPICGFDRKNLFRNFAVMAKLVKSILLARKTVKQFKPDVAIGVGGYASGPTLWAASHMNIPTVIQEQNSYAGVTNKLLASKANAICVAYTGMEKFFPADKIILTGNPVRQELLNDTVTKEEAIAFFGLNPDKKTILVIGGSLGARTVNESIALGLNKFATADVQVIWQTGKIYDKAMSRQLADSGVTQVKQMPFIARMDMAYKAADLVISRAGASSISELCLLGKPSILVPSPNVAEDHQTKNALALVKANAAVMVTDADAGNRLVDDALQLMAQPQKWTEMSENIRKLALPDSANRIVDVIEDIIENKGNK